MNIKKEIGKISSEASHNTGNSIRRKQRKNSYLVSKIPKIGIPIKKVNVTKSANDSKISSVKIPSSRSGMLVGSTRVFHLVLQQQLERVGEKHLISKFVLANSIEEVSTYHNNTITHLGLKFGTKRYKDVCVYCIQLLEGVQNPEVPGRVSVGLKDRWPNCLGPLRPLFHQVRDNGPYRKVGDQVIRSLLAMQRVVEDFSEIALTEIESKREISKEFLDEYNSFIEESEENLIYSDNLSEMEERINYYLDSLGL